MCSPLYLTYSQMIDIALGSSKIDIFQSNILRTVLKCLVTQLDLQQTRIDYHGPNRDIILKQILNPEILPTNLNLRKMKVKGEIDKPENWICTLISKRPEDEYKVNAIICVEEGEFDCSHVEQTVQQKDTAEKPDLKTKPDIKSKTRAVVKRKRNEKQKQTSHKAEEVSDNCKIDHVMEEMLPQTTNICPMAKIPNKVCSGCECGADENDCSTQPYCNVMHTNSGTILKLIYHPGISKQRMKEEIISELSTHFNIDTKLKELDQKFSCKLNKFEEFISTNSEMLKCEFYKVQTETNRLSICTNILRDLSESNRIKIESIEKCECEIVCKLDDTIQKTLCLLAENEICRSQIKDIKESIEAIKSNKADKEIVDAFVNSKADKEELITKVPYSTFNIIRNDLSCLITEALQKYYFLSYNLENNIKNLKHLIDKKLNACEKKLREYVDMSLHDLNKKTSFKINTNICLEGIDTAAAFIKDFKCIACQSGQTIPSVKNEEENVTKHIDAPRPKSTSKLYKPSRKNTKLVALVHSRQAELVKSRPCGGLCTLTRPIDRVPRQSSFYDIYPTSTTCTNTYIQGSDGVLYRGDPSN